MAYLWPHLVFHFKLRDGTTMIWTRYHVDHLSGKYLYRFLQEEFLFEFLEKKAIWFSRADCFDDKMECALLTEISGKYNHDKIVERQRRHLVSCWHLATHESYALWNSYAKMSNDRRVAAIRFRMADLVRSVEESVFQNEKFHQSRRFIHGAINYMDLLGPRAASDRKNLVKYPAFRKEQAFSFENEYRFVVRLTTPYKPKGFLYGLVTNMPLLHFHVILNPLLDKEECQRLKEKLAAKGYGQYWAETDLRRWLQPGG
jgi:hypothetical protein